MWHTTTISFCTGPGTSINPREKTLACSSGHKQRTTALTGKIRGMEIRAQTWGTWTSSTAASRSRCHSRTDPRLSRQRRRGWRPLPTAIGLGGEARKSVCFGLCFSFLKIHVWKVHGVLTLVLSASLQNALEIIFLFPKVLITCNASFLSNFFIFST